MTGVPRATVLHRYRRLIDRCGTAVSTADLLAALTLGQDRRVVIRLLLPSGKTLSGGVRAVVAMVLDDVCLASRRPEHLGASAIRARLRRIRGWPEDPAPAAVQWAFGFRPNAGPTNSLSTAAA